MASKSGQQEPEKAEVIEELLDALDTTLDRVKVLYEQYFLGIQKQPPAYLHTDIERKIRDLAQIQIRNTALRYRFATLQQKFGSYNSYWRRTLRQIENGTYARNLHKVGRQAARTGAAVPEEILAAMPKRMRDQVIRDREAALALARLRERQAQDDELLTLADEDVEIDVGDLDTDDLDPAAFIRESSDVRRNALTAGGAHRVDETDAEFDVDAFFASVTQDDAPSRDTLSRPATAEPAGDAERPRRSGRASSRPPVVARTATGHPRPAALSGMPGAAVPPGGPGAPVRGRRPSTRRPPTDEGPPSFAESTGLAARKTTGAIRTVRPPSSPGGEPAVPDGPTGRMPTARPALSADAGPQLSVPPLGSASPAAATRKITGPMRTLRPPSSSDLEPASGPGGAAERAAPQGAAAQSAAAPPASSGSTGARLSIPSIKSATPAAATRRITPPARAAVRPPSDADLDSETLPIPTSSAAAAPASSPSSTPVPGRATGQGRAVAAPASAGAGPGSGSGPATVRLTAPGGAAAAPAGGDAGSASGAVRATGQSRAVGPASADAGSTSAAVQGTGTSRAVAAPTGAEAGSASAAAHGTGTSRAVSAPASGDAGSASAAARATGSSRAVAAPASSDAGSAGSASPGDEPSRRDAGAFAAESTQRARPVVIPVIPPVPPLGGPRAPLSPSASSDPARMAPSQATKPLRVAPGSAAAHAATPVETLAGPFPRIPSPPSSRAAPVEPPAIPAPPPSAERTPAPARRPAPEPTPAEASSPPAAAPAADAAAALADEPRSAPPSPAARRTPPPMRAVTPAPVPPKRADAPRSASGERAPSEPRQAPPPGMTDADVNALYAKYVKAKQILGEEAEPGTYGKLLKTINAQAPKIMEQYKAKGVDFSVVVKDNQVIIRAKPKP